MNSQDLYKEIEAHKVQIIFNKPEPGAAPLMKLMWHLLISDEPKRIEQMLKPHPGQTTFKAWMLDELEEAESTMEMLGYALSEDDKRCIRSGNAHLCAYATQIS